MDIPDQQLYIGAAVLSIGLIVGAVALSGQDDSGDLEASERQSVQVADESLYSGQSFGDLNDNVVSGGVPQDGIPSIDDPNFVSGDEANLDDGDIVFGIEHEGEIRAYPQRILVSHEIVNDEFGGETHAVTYCPLTATAMGQKSGAEVGVSGNLVNSNLIMYDRDTESYWPQIMSTAISGEKEGESMRSSV